MITENVQIRAGSLVLPLHNPVRVAEDSALVENLFAWMRYISFATGWHEHDYVIAPANFRKTAVQPRSKTSLWFGGYGPVRM